MRGEGVKPQHSKTHTLPSSWPLLHNHRPPPAQPPLLVALSSRLLLSASSPQLLSHRTLLLMLPAASCSCSVATTLGTAAPSAPAPSAPAAPGAEPNSTASAAWSRSMGSRRKRAMTLSARASRVARPHGYVAQLPVLHQRARAAQLRARQPIFSEEAESVGALRAAAVELLRADEGSCALDAVAEDGVLPAVEVPLLLGAVRAEAVLEDRAHDVEGVHLVRAHVVQQLQLVAQHAVLALPQLHLKARHARRKLFAVHACCSTAAVSTEQKAKSSSCQSCTVRTAVSSARGRAAHRSESCTRC